MKPSSVLVTNATGFVARHLVRELIDRGYHVRALVKKESGDIDLTRLSVLGAELLSEKVSLKTFGESDAVVHLAGIIRESKNTSFYKINVENTKRIAENSMHIIYLSSIGASPVVRSPYLNSKYEAEQVIRQSNIPYTIFRPGLVYGQGSRILSGLAELGRIKQLIPKRLLQKNVQPLYVNDLVGMLIEAIENTRHRNRMYAVAGPDVLTFDEIINILREAHSIRRLPLPGILSRFYPKSRMPKEFFQALYYSPACSMSFRRVFSVSLTPFRKGVAMSIPSQTI